MYRISRFLTTFHSFTATDSLTANSRIAESAGLLNFARLNSALDFRVRTELAPFSFLVEQDISLEQKLFE